jgi:hypothetical protein
MSDNVISFDEENIPENCQPKSFDGFGYELMECGSKNALCKYVLSFGYGYLCRHPHRREFIQRLNGQAQFYPGHET